MNTLKRKKEIRLSNAPLGVKCMIRDIQSNPETSQRLREIGFNKHTAVRTVVLNSSQLICEIHNTRIGLHRRIANEIVIELAETHLREVKE
ncbi:MAG: FeoA domain-containing protein [Bacteroidota bacterium]